MAHPPHPSVSLLAAMSTLALGVLSMSFWIPGVADAKQSNGDAASNAISVSPDIDSDWRYTKFGWQNASSWVGPNAGVPRQTIELMHPLVWAGIVLISVITAMIWASNEWDFGRLFSDADEPAEQIDILPHRN